MSPSKTVSDLEARHGKAMALLGDIVATLNRPANRAKIKAGDSMAVVQLLSWASRWEEKYLALKAGGG